MPRVDVVRRVTIAHTPRVVQLAGLFDLPRETTSEQRWTADVPIEDRPWAVGLIVGPSGAGKSTVARTLFGDAVIHDFVWPPDRSVVDGFPAALSIKDVTGLLSAVGFSSPPAWLRPYAALSTGEQFRVTLARALADPAPCVVMDEFTSVIDRTVAQIGSAAVAQAVRRSGRQFVAVTCHYDVEDWLQPDWVFQPHLSRFHWRALQRRPAVHLDLRRCRPDAWRLFAPHHYLTRDLNRAARCFLASWGDRPVAFVAVMPLMGFFGRWREHRLVCLPEFQGIGIGLRVSEAVGGIVRALGAQYSSTSSHPGLIAARTRSAAWRLSKAPAINGRHTLRVQTNWRFSAAFQYCGPTCADVARARALWAGQ